MKPYETIKYNGYKINIYNDEFAESPRTAYENIASIICWHSRYDLGDKHDFETPDEFLEWAAESGVYAMPLYMYDHSGITISTTPFSCKWDSGQIGWVCVDSKSLVASGMSDTPEDAKAIMKQEVEEYDLYLRGEIYGHEIEELEHVSWGYYGFEYCLESAKEIIDGTFVMMKAA